MDPNSEKDYLRNLQSDGVSAPIEQVTDSQQLHLPVWYDEAKFKHAQDFYRRNAYAVGLGVLYGAVALMALPSILSVLMFTKRSSSVLTAYRRYMETILHFVGWYTEELKPGTKYWKSLEYVRRAHSTTSKRANSKTSGYVVLSPRMLGIQYNADDMEAFVHFWRVLGYMLGIEDRYNLCTADMSTSVHRMEKVRDKVVIPALTTVGEDFQQMARYMLDGMWYYNVLLNPDAIMYITYRMTEVPGYGRLSGKNYEKLSLYSRIVLWLLVKVHEFGLTVDWLRRVLNSLIGLSVKDGIRPLPAIIRFGFKKATVRI